MGAKWELDLWHEMWDRAGRQGLDAWYGIGWVYERFCGSYPCWSLATLEGQEAHAEGYDGHYYAWLKYVLRRLGIRVREEA